MQYTIRKLVTSAFKRAITQLYAQCLSATRRFQVGNKTGSAPSLKGCISPVRLEWPNRASLPDVKFIREALDPKKSKIKLGILAEFGLPVGYLEFTLVPVPSLWRVPIERISYQL